MSVLKRLLVLIVVCASVFATAGALVRFTYREGQKIFRYAIAYPMHGPASGREMLGWLTRNGFDVAGFDWKAGTIEIVTDQFGIDKLNARGVAGRVIAEQIPGTRPLGVNAVDPNYLTPEKSEAQLKALATRYPQLTRLEQIGTSNEGRPIWALLISTTPARGGELTKPSLIFDGLHHAREVMTAEIVMDVAQNLLASQRTSQTAADLLSRWNIWVVPMLNVDGNNVVWTRDSWWRKNTRAENARVFGVDINRNYPFQWGNCNGSSTSQRADDFRGSAAASEPETQALMRLGQAVRPAASLSYHSYSELVLYPHGCSGTLSGENALLEKVGRELASILPSDSGRGNYQPGTPWQILYGVDGDSMSYMHAEFGAIAYTFEVNTSFQPPYSLREPTLIKHRKAWQYFLSRIDAGLLTLKVTDGRTGQPAQAMIDISTIVHKYGEKPFQSNAAGNFFKVLDPGKYFLRATLADGRSAQFEVEMTGTATSQQIAIP